MSTVGCVLVLCTKLGTACRWIDSAFGETAIRNYTYNGICTVYLHADRSGLHSDPVLHSYMTFDDSRFRTAELPTVHASLHQDPELSYTKTSHVTYVQMTCVKYAEVAEASPFMYHNACHFRSGLQCCDA